MKKEGLQRKNGPQDFDRSERQISGERERLFEAVEAECRNFPGKVSCLFRDYEDPGLFFDRCAQDRTVSASVIKVPYAIAFLRELEEKGLTLEYRMTIRKDMILDDSEVFEYGETTVSFRELIYWMLVNSDNTASNAIVSFLGFEKVNANFEALGLQDTLSERLMLDFDAVREGRNNYTSLRDIEKCMEALLFGRILTERHRTFLLDTLSRNRDHLMLERYLYEDVRVMHKSGELDDVRHDSGLFFYGKRRWFLGVFCSAFSPEAGPEAERLAGRISRKVLDYYEVCNRKAEEGLSL